MKILNFLEQNNIPYNDLSLYEEAFTHPSYANESSRNRRDYERLEFMGDAVLQLYVSKYIFKLYPNIPEGELTRLRSKLVREESLARFSNELNLPDLLLLGHGEEKTGGRHRESVIANIFESFVGALYLDVGEEYVLKILDQTIFKHVDDLDYDDIKDYKSKLQELIQSDNRLSYSYELVSTSGPANAPIFTVNVLMDNMIMGQGTGTSKKRAEQKAAQDALNRLAKQ